mgnify:CR=1 FL=1
MDSLKEGYYLIENIGGLGIAKIFYKDGQLHYSTDGDYELPVTLLDRNEYIKIIRPIDLKRELVSPKLHLTFKDTQGNKFTYTASSTAVFRRKLDFLPEILKMLKS